LGGSLSPVIFGVLVQKGLWAAPFLIQAGVLITGALVWLFLIRPDQSVVGNIEPLSIAAH
jgi:hypothetical protein